MIDRAFSTSSGSDDRSGDGEKPPSPVNTGSAERHHLLILKVGEFGRCAYGKVVRDYRGLGRGR